MSCRVTLCHVMSRHVMSCHTASCRVASHVTLLISCRIASRCFPSCSFTSHHFASGSAASHRHVASCRMKSRPITLSQLMSRHVVSQLSTFCQIVTLCAHTVASGHVLLALNCVLTASVTPSYINLLTHVQMHHLGG